MISLLAWLVASLCFLTFEMLSPGFFFFLSFFCGALGAAIVAVWNNSPVVQGASFILVSLITFAVLRYWLKKRHSFSHTHYQSNAYALIGKQGVVTVAVEPSSFGQVKIQGAVWSAKSLRNSSLAAGEVVEVVNVVGCHVVVKKQSLSA